MAVMGFHQRMAEIWCGLKRKGELTIAEQDEMAICLDANMNWVWRMIKLENLSMLATQTNDTEWLQEICARIEELEHSDMKKPGRKRSTD